MLERSWVWIWATESSNSWISFHVIIVKFMLRAFKDPRLARFLKRTIHTFESNEPINCINIFCFFVSYNIEYALCLIGIRTLGQLEGKFRWIHWAMTMSLIKVPKWILKLITHFPIQKVRLGIMLSTLWSLLCIIPSQKVRACSIEILGSAHVISCLYGLSLTWWHRTSLTQ